MTNDLIKAKVTLEFDKTPGQRIFFRSLLEARWASFFECFCFDWLYEPYTFELPDGSRYTPDFYLDGVGWIEIKPNINKLKEVQEKLKNFSYFKAQLIPSQYSKRFFSISVNRPTFCKNYAIVEWLPNSFKTGGKKFAVDTICSPYFSEFKNQYPDQYVNLLDKIFENASAKRSGGFYSMKEVLTYTLLDMGYSFNDILRTNKN
jgi:hypothetical protein